MDQIELQNNGTLSEENPDATLQLADGTQTEVSQDNTLTNAKLKPQSYTFNFASGNFDGFEKIGKNINLKIQTVRQTLMPLFNVALIELLGSDQSIKYDSFNYSVKYEQNTFKIQIEIIISAKEWIGNDITYDMAKHDTDYIMNRLKVVPNIIWHHCLMDTKDGSIKIEFTI